MGGKVKLSAGAKIERAKLPHDVRNELDEHLDRLANQPGVSSLAGMDSLDGIGPDGLRFHVEFVYEYKQNELMINLIDVLSY
jgi:hypothetical protein